MWSFKPASDSILLQETAEFTQLLLTVELLSEDLKWAGKLAAWMRSKLGEPAAKDGAQAGG